MSAAPARPGLAAPSQSLPIPTNALLWTAEGQQRRIRITAGCDDCAHIPKVAKAGEVLDGPDGEYQVMHNGVQVVKDGYQGAWQTEVIRQLRGHHEPQEELVFHEILRHVRPGGTMVELGSYWAYYSLWFQKQIPAATTFMIEPDPNNLEVGRRNFALNGMPGSFFQYAVGRASRAAAPMPCETGEYTVPTISVDDFVSAHGLGSVDILLSDIQGYEAEMLEGAGRSIERGVLRFIVVSTHHHMISNDPLTHQKCLHALQERGACILAEHTVGESFSGDGLIVASFRREDRAIPTIEVSRNGPSHGLFRPLEYDLAEAREELAALRQQLRAVRQELDEAREAVWPHLSARPARTLVRRARQLWQSAGSTKAARGTPRDTHAGPVRGA